MYLTILSVSLSRKSIQQLQVPSNEIGRPTEKELSRDKRRTILSDTGNWSSCGQIPIT